LHDKFAGIFGIKLLAQPGCDGLLDVRIDLLTLDVLVTSDAVNDSDQFLWIHKLFGSFAINFSFMRAVSCGLWVGKSIPSNLPPTTNNLQILIKQKSHLSAATVSSRNL